MAIGTDFAISAAKAITYTGTAHGVALAGYHSVIDFHRWLQDLADDAVASGDDLLDITNLTPSDRSTDNIITLINGYNINQEVSEHLFDGSIIQTGGDDVWDGLVVIAAEGMDLQIIQEGTTIVDPFWNTIPNGETTKGLNRDVANGISHRFMLKVKTAGTAIDGQRIVGNTRQTGFTYSEFKINGTANGNNVLALTYAVDLNDTVDASGLIGITNTTEGYVLLDIKGDLVVDEPFYSEWNTDGNTSKQFYERMKYLTVEGTATTFYGIPGEDFRGITHELTITSGTGTWGTPPAQAEQLTWTGGTGQLLAVDNLTGTAATALWMQILTGVAPTSGVVTGTTSAATATISAASEKTVPAPFCGSSTGSALIGAYGFGMEANDAGASDLFTDLDGNTIQPPNNVTFTVDGTVSTEDRVLVGPKGVGTTLQSGQFLLDTTIIDDAASIIFKAGTEIPGTGTDSETNTPTSGTIRLARDTDGVFQLITYTGYTVQAATITFTGCVAAKAATVGNSGYISYIDKIAAAGSESFTVVAAGTRDLFIRVRDGGTAGDLEGIKTFETTGALINSNSSTTVIRTSDV